jgi:DNA-binding response OmpR family regulator
MRIFILEDDGNRINFFLEKFCNYDVTITENAQSAIEYLEDNIYGCLFLDHDLGKNNGSGLDVVHYLADNPDNVNNDAIIIIHSWNIPATEKMITVLPKAAHMPFDVGVFSAIEL